MTSHCSSASSRGAQGPGCGDRAVLPLTILWLQISTGFGLYKAGHEVVMPWRCAGPRPQGSGCRNRCGALGARPCHGQGGHQGLQRGLPVWLRAVQVGLRCAPWLALVLHRCGGRKGQEPTAWRPISPVGRLQVGSSTHHPGSCPPVGTSSAGRPGTGSGGPCPLGTFLPPPGTCRWVAWVSVSCWTVGFGQVFPKHALRSPGVGAGLPGGSSPRPPVDEPPPHAPFEEAAAAVAGVDAVVLPAAAVPTHAALKRGASACEAGRLSAGSHTRHLFREHPLPLLPFPISEPAPLAQAGPWRPPSPCPPPRLPVS